MHIHTTKWAQIALALLLLFSIVKRVQRQGAPHLDDFRVYETAAFLVEQHLSPLMYEGADTGVDPQLRFADPNSSFAKAAQSLGVSQVRLYVYPPVLADLLLPLAFVNAKLAGTLWTALNILALLGFVIIAGLLLRIKLKTIGFLALLIGALTNYPAHDCFEWGQVTLLLLLLWTLGVFFYARRSIPLSAAAFALATAIKLTPAIIVIPFFLWREWRWIRLYALCLAIFFGLALLINGPATVEDYFLHVMPAMSNGNAFPYNRSLITGFQIIYVLLQGADPNLPYAHIPHGLVLIAKACAFLCLLATTALIARLPRHASTHGRTIVLALLAMLSVAISPVSWPHAYAVCLLPLACLWAEALRGRPSLLYLALLTLCSLELSNFEISFAFFKFLHQHAYPIVTSLAPLCALALVLYRLSRANSFLPKPSPLVPSFLR